MNSSLNENEGNKISPLQVFRMENLLLVLEYPEIPIGNKVGLLNLYLV